MEARRDSTAFASKRPTETVLMIDDDSKSLRSHVDYGEDKVPRKLSTKRPLKDSYRKQWCKDVHQYCSFSKLSNDQYDTPSETESEDDQLVPRRHIHYRSTRNSKMDSYFLGPPP